MSELQPTLLLTPHGHLLLAPAVDAQAIPVVTSARLQAAFARGAGHGLLSLGTHDIGVALPPVIAWWRQLAERYVTALCLVPEVPERALGGVPAPALGDLQALAWTAPPMAGAEYLTAEVLLVLWTELDRAFLVECAEARQSVQEFLKARNPAWNLVGRVHVHLAENRKDEHKPFAFLATYTTRLSAQATAQHLPLGQALKEFAGAADKERLLALLLPLQRAGEHCPWLKDLITSREIFHPLRWSPAEALQFLHDVPHLEQAGVVVRMPATWRANRPPRAQVKATVGTRAPSQVGQDALLDFSIDLALDGEPLSASEAQQLLRSTQGLVLIRGRWVEVDRDRLQKTLEHFKQVEQLAADQGLGFHAAMRLLAGAGAVAGERSARSEPEWSQVVAGPWLAETLQGLRGPQGLADVAAGAELRATLRPYQQTGVQWLHLLSRLRLGACLADDMGLGKTIQIIALLLVRRKAEGSAPSLLVAPASLLANWAQEVARFAPSLRVLTAHSSALPADEVKQLDPTRVAGCDLVITSYGALHRLSWLTAITWRLVVVDEAQAIKNPGTRQTRAVKELKADARIALTGTPIENRLGDLWSIIDFINPGLLGSAKAFTAFTKTLATSPQGYAPLRTLVQPYLLRRLKTDKSVISDLPDKSELTAFCALSRRQAALYQQTVDALAKALAKEDPDGIARKGLVLAFLMRFKQICNHPSQWLGDGAWDEADSGKLARLRELTEVIAEKQEKVLVFSQFRETTAPLAAFLGGIFGRPGLVLTGETPVKQRKDLVNRFQNDERVPFFVLSLKAGGSGLNLTAASHVIHFDRWWNPAVENQATDRAFRIGQTRNVLVHKFVCRGTIEERIDAMIAEKRQLSHDLLDDHGGGDAINLTNLADDDLLKLVRLDLSTASAET
ncbi:MAG: DEAD/DEAH box helicase [Planctomycetes bacterium]|nr:DEAD/DEAH box helicase [Planctomycetota bacterium]